MAIWDHTLKIKHLLTDKQDYESIQKSMSAIAKVIASAPFMHGFPLYGWCSIPEGDGVFGPVDYANKLLAKLYDFADSQRIWID